jgi:hypothetical protein
MSNEDRHTKPGASSWRLYLTAATLMALIVGAVLVVITRRDSENTNATLSSRPETTIAPTSTRASDSKAEVVTRLREIIDVREQAFRSRDARLLEEVYASDCSCLRAGRDAIAALKKERVKWKNRSISIKIESTRRINSKLWEAVGLFISAQFRIETEEGVLVREVPAERLRYRFLLVRPSDEVPWRLGSASPVEG